VSRKIGILVLLLLPNLARAAFSNYNSILIGDQAAGMGGAATAMTEDASAAAWYNPATLAKLQGQSFSAAVGIYKKFDTQYGKSEDLTKATTRVNQGFFRALPSSTGSIIRPEEVLSDWTLALSILVPEYDSFKGDVNSTDNNNSSLTLVDEQIWVGLGAGKMISSDESLGVTLYYTARSLDKSLIDQTSSPTVKTFEEEKSLTQNAVVAIVGYHQDVRDDLRWGFSWRLPCLPVAGKASYHSSYYEAGGSINSVNKSDINTTVHIPSKLSSGVAMDFMEKRLTVAADLSYYGADSYLDMEEASVAEYIEHRQTLNGSLGFEYKVRDWIKLRWGAFTNLSSHPAPAVGKVKGQGDHVDQLGFAANVAVKSRNIQYTFGGYYTGGQGESVQRINQNYEVISKTQQVFTMLVGTSYSF